MTSPVDASGLDAVLGQTLQALDQLRTRPPGEDGESEPVQGIGEAADGLIRAVAMTGQLADLYLDPLVMRMSPETVAYEIMTAVNGAMADLQEQTAGQFAGIVDLDALAGQL
jgi:hypothetical protein